MHQTRIKHQLYDNPLYSYFLLSQFWEYKKMGVSFRYLDYVATNFVKSINFW